MEIIKKLNSAFPLKDGWETPAPGVYIPVNDNMSIAELQRLDREVESIQLKDDTITLVWDDGSDQEFLPTENFDTIDELVAELEIRASAYNR